MRSKSLKKLDLNHDQSATNTLLKTPRFHSLHHPRWQCERNLENYLSQDGISEKKSNGTKSSKNQKTIDNSSELCYRDDSCFPTGNADDHQKFYEDHRKNMRRENLESRFKPNQSLSIRDFQREHELADNFAEDPITKLRKTKSAGQVSKL